MARKPFPYPVEYDVGPFIGVRDQVDAKPGPRDQLAGALNCYRDSEAEGVWRTRPGMNKLAALQLGSASSRTGQAVFQATRLDGSEFSFLFVGGRLYEYLWPTLEYADRTPSAGTTAPAGFTIHPTNRIYCVMFADYMIVSDGANRPWKYNPSTRVASYLTDVVFVIFGPMWVYYSKLFGIKSLERNVLVWSEELDPDIGYENALYNNRWILGQTSQDPLEVGFGTNTQIYLFRNVTALGISGAVTEEFQTQGTADDYPTGIAKNGGASLLRVEGDLFFLDTLFRPTRIGPGDQFEPLWQALWNTVKGFDTAAGALLSSLVLPDLELIAFAIPTLAELATGRPRNLYMFTTDGTYQGIWTGPAAFSAMGVLKDENRSRRPVVRRPGVRQGVQHPDRRRHDRRRRGYPVAGRPPDGGRGLRRRGHS